MQSYNDGEGVKQDYVKTIYYYYEQAAVQDDATAQCNLGILYQHGHNEQPDLIRARYYYEQTATQQGFDYAKEALKSMIEDEYIPKQYTATDRHTNQV
jgi:TPR repeat protein